MKNLPLNTEFEVQAIKTPDDGSQKSDEICSRIFDLGIYPHVRMTLVGRSPFRGPYIFRLNNIFLALREEEVQCLNIRPIKRD